MLISWADPERGDRGSGPLENYKWLKVSLAIMVRTPREAIEPLWFNCFSREVCTVHCDVRWWLKKDIRAPLKKFSGSSHFCWVKCLVLMDKVPFNDISRVHTCTVSHFFRAHIFWQKCLNRTFSMIIYLLTFYLFDNIEKNYWNHSCESFCYSKAILTNFDKCTCKRTVYIFYFCFVLGIIHGDRCDRKTPKTIHLFK